MKSFLGLLLAGSLWAGQSLTSGSSVTANVPVYSTSNSFTIEYCGHSINAGTAFGRWVRANSFGIDAYFASNNFIVLPYNTNAIGFAEGNMGTVFPDGAICVRIAKDTAINTIRLEMWDQNGVRKINSTRTYTSQDSSASAGVNFREDSSLGGLAYARVKNYAVAANSRPPTTYDTDPGIIYEWKFDGNLNASTGGINATWTLPTAPTYGTTLYQGAYAVAQVNPTEWASVTSMRAGLPQTLLSNSYSQSDTSNSVSCRWSQVSGPSVAVFSAPNICNVSVTGLIFGTYGFRLAVQDIAGNTAETTITAGAVATDNNGVVVNKDAAADLIFGPMIAYGKNPWGWADEAAYRGMTLRSAVYSSNWPKDWLTTHNGSVAYNASVVVAKGTLASSITSTSTSVTLNSGHSIETSTLPTLIVLEGIPGYSGEMALVCSVVGNTLTFCPDGRGWGTTTAAAHGAGGGVFQNRAVGTGTSFLSTYCQAGAVSPEGFVTYSTGTVTLTAGSTSVTGSGTNWTTANGVVGDTPWWIRVAGATAGGTPFVFMSPLTSVGSTTSLTMKNAFPASGDSGSYSYQIIRTRFKNWSPKYLRGDGSTGQTYYGVGLCTSDTVLYFDRGLEAVSGNQTNQQYASYQNLWFTSGGNGDPNFYDEVLANYALWLRSGDETARQAARKLSVNYLTNPQLDEGYAVEAFPRGASITGAFAAATIDGQTGNWAGLRKFAQSGVSAIAQPCSTELRENSYRLSWLALAAGLDPDSTNRANWQAQLANAYTRDLGCKGASGGYYSAQWNGTGPLQLTAGSPIVTGSGLNANICQRTAGGTGTIVSNAGTMTLSTGTPSGTGQICITGTRSGAPYIACFRWSVAGSTVTLGGQWIGDTGSVTWQTESDGNQLTISSTNPPSEASNSVQHTCTWNSPTQITLDRNWDGPTTNAGYLYRGNLSGTGVQPFVLGIKTLQMTYAASGATGATATNYATLRDDAATWVLTNGYDPLNAGMYYGRGYSACEPIYGQGSGFFDYRQLGCAYSQTNYTDARGLLAEAQNALRIWYQAAPTPANKTTGDNFVSAQWGFKWTTGGVPSSVWNNDFATDNNLASGKWLGFQFGIGMSHQWPAARLGGVQPQSLVSRTLFYAPPAGTTVTVARLIWPNGAPQDYLCSGGSCTVQYDSRQGTGVIYQMLYYRSGNLISTGQLLPLDFN